MNEILRSCWVALQAIPLNEKIYIIVVCLTALSAEFARQAARHAREANYIALQSSIRAERMAIFRAVSDFLHYCSIYSTMFPPKMVNSTRDLSARIDGFKMEVRQHAFLHMPEANEIIKTATSKAHNLQRLLDRFASSNPMPEDQEYKDIKENIDILTGWFSEQERNLQKLFGSYF